MLQRGNRGNVLEVALSLLALETPPGYGVLGLCPHPRPESQRGTAARGLWLSHPALYPECRPPRQPVGFVFKFIYLFIYFEGEREWERDTERACENPKQALHLQRGARRGAQTHKPRDRDLSRSRSLDRLSPPGAPASLCS